MSEKDDCEQPTDLRVEVVDRSAQDRLLRYGCTVRWPDGRIESKNLHDWREWCQRHHEALYNTMVTGIEGAELSLQAEEALKDGTWKMHVNKALRELVAGEPDLCWFLVYSGLSSQLRDQRVHDLMLGESQYGKSFVQRCVAEGLFPSILVSVSTMSPKAVFYKAKEEKDPRVLDKKLLMVDEVGDLSDETRAILKQMASNGQHQMVNMTVDDQKRYQEQLLEGMPVFWTNSKELFKDIGSQFVNRFFKTTIDESLEQSVRVDLFQKKSMAFADLQHEGSSVPVARAIIEKIMEEGDFIVLNLFADLIEQQNFSARNRLPMFHSLLSAITYANRLRRRSFTPDGEKHYLLATLSDNIEALRLWALYSGSQGVGLPPRHQRVLEAMEEGISYTVEDATEAYNVRCKNPSDRISSKTMANYLSELCERNILNSSRKEEVRFNETHLSRERYYQRLPGISLVSSQLQLRKTHRDLDGMLEVRLEELKSYLSQAPKPIPDCVFVDIKGHLNDCDYPPSETTQTAVDDNSYKRDLIKDDRCLREYIGGGSATFERAMNEAPDTFYLLQRYIREGRIRTRPDHILEWARG